MALDLHRPALYTCVLKEEFVLDSWVQIHGSPGDRARMNGLLRGLIPLLALVFTAGCLLGLLMPVTPAVRPLIAVALVVSVGGGVWLVGYLRRIGTYFKGARGEELVGARLAVLPGGWHVFHDLSLDSRFDADHVVVGPGGVFVVETKFWSGRVTVGQGKILVDGSAPSRSPLAQVETAAGTLSTWLAVRLEQAPAVVPILCFAGTRLPDGVARVGNVRVCGDIALAAELMSRNGQLTQDTVAAIVARLNS